MVTWRSMLLGMCLLMLAEGSLFGQSFTRKTYHDREKKNIKEIYQVKDTLQNIPHGRYVSYFLNGTIESKGQFTNSETTGVWEFFYETGNLKMRGILRQNGNYGLWEYFYESGRKSMEGMINGKNRQGEWRSYYENGQVKEFGSYSDNKRDGIWTFYFEDGSVRGEIDYKADFGTYKEFYHSGKVLAEGPKRGVKNVGHWRFFAEDGTLQTEGDYLNGKKNGDWITYFANGKISSKGAYANDVPVGKWDYYYEDGKISSSGEYSGGVKTGSWKTMNTNGTMRSEANFVDGQGEYREYYPEGQLKVKGWISNNKKEGKWQYYYEDGGLEGECTFESDKGIYFGYYPNGSLRTKGSFEGDQKVGTWELYENDGKLSGYYRPFYEGNKMQVEMAELSKPARPARGAINQKLTYFDERFNEFRGLIISGNPVMTLAGRFPLAIEYYLQERLGTELELTTIRSPFFKSSLDIPLRTPYERGYSMAVRQKYYNQTRSGMWYFGHEMRFMSQSHYVNDINLVTEAMFTAAALENRIQYGVLVGYRLMQRNNAPAYTVDAFVSANAGYRGFRSDAQYERYFLDMNQSRLVGTVHVGLNFGRVLSFR